MKNKNIVIFSLMLFSLLFTAEGHAKIYKCVKANNDVYYNDKPCPVSDAETQIKSEKDPVNGYIPPDFVKDKNNLKSSVGVVVGEESLRNIDKTSKDNSKSESLNDKNSGGNNVSTGNNKNPTNDSSNSVDTQSSVQSSGENVDVNNSKGKSIGKLNVIHMEPIIN